jgi:hypothetical protein
VADEMRGRMPDGREGVIRSLSDFGWGTIALDDGEVVQFNDMNGPEVIQPEQKVRPYVLVKVTREDARHLIAMMHAYEGHDQWVVSFAHKLGNAIEDQVPEDQRGEDDDAL